MSANLAIYKAAWSHLFAATQQLQSTQVGVDKELFKTIERIIMETEGAMSLVDTLIDAEEAK